MKIKLAIAALFLALVNLSGFGTNQVAKCQAQTNLSFDECHYHINR